MSYTPNLNLMLTPQDDTTTKFKEWRVGMNGDDSESNMSKIDKAAGELFQQRDDIKNKINVVSDKIFGESPQTWKDVQSIVRNGLASQYFDIGDQFIVERLDSVSAEIRASATGTAMSLSVDADKFVAAMGEVRRGAYLFTYDGRAWRNNAGDIIEPDAYGITLPSSDTPAVSWNIEVMETTTSFIFDVIGFDHDEPVDENYTHSMTLQLHDLYQSPVVFDAPEATWYLDPKAFPSGLAAGTYYFTLPSINTTYGGGKTFNFTLTRSLPPAGVIHFDWKRNTQASACRVYTYPMAGTTDALEVLSVAEGEAGIAMPAINTSAFTENTNSAQRMLYGSNNWHTSNLRQWLNSDGAAGTWWMNQTKLDRPGNADKDGFLKGIDPSFLAVVGNVKKITLGTAGMTSERFFVPSASEVYGSADTTEGTAYEYYGNGYSASNAPSAAGDINRNKYKNGVNERWWLRTKANNNSHQSQTVTHGGYLTWTEAGDSNGNGVYVAPVCAIV